MVDFSDDPGGELRRKARSLQWLCVCEAFTYSVLFVFWVSGNDVGTKVTGSLHGMVVLAFAAMVIMITPAMRWSWWFTALSIATGPIGAALVYERIRREGTPAPA